MTDSTSASSGAQPDYECLLKYLIIGNSGVGKSCLLIRFAEDSWNETYVTTIGVDFKIKSLDINNKTVKLQIWDTAGQERFRNITSSYYKGAQGIMMVFDITDVESFNNLGSWLSEIDKHASKNVHKILVGNKTDLAHQRKVSIEQASAFAAQYKMKYIETSAKKSDNVNEAFLRMTEDIVSQSGEKKFIKKEDNIVINTNANIKLKTGCCK